MLKRNFYNTGKAKNSYLRIGLFVVFFAIPFSKILSQISPCQNIYIWNFKVKNNSIKQNIDIQNTLTDEVEDIVISLDSCSVLQRRNYSRLSNQFSLEKDVETLEGIPQELLQEFKLIGAKYVLFGEMSQDYNFNLNLRLTIESLETKKIEVAKSIFIPAEVLINREKRYELLENKIKECLLDNNNSAPAVISQSSFDFNNKQTIKKPILPQSISKLGLTVYLNGCNITAEAIECKFQINGLRKEKIIIPQKGNVINTDGNSSHNENSKWVSSIKYGEKNYSGKTISLLFAPTKSRELTFRYNLSNTEFRKPGILTLNINGIGFTFSNYIIKE